MEQKSITYQQLGDESGINYSSLHRALNGKRDTRLRVSEIDALAKALGVTPQELVRPPVPEAA